jgi:phage-related protein
LSSDPVIDKPLLWVGTSRADVRKFSAAARRLAGFQLRRVQQGLDPNDWKPMPAVGPGVRELRIRVNDAYRVFYVATFDEGVYIIHAFAKKAHKTSRRDLEVGRERFRALIAMRKQQHGKEQPR